MKKRLIGLLLSVMLVFVCVGCGAEKTTTEPTETATTTSMEESTTEQTEEVAVTPEKTAEPTPEAKEEPTEETTEPTETVEQEPTEVPTPEPQATYTYTDMSATMYAQQTVNIRDLPDTSGNKLGSLSTNDEIKISGQCNENGWYMFEYNGNVAFVSNKYVSENKVEIQQAPADNSTANSGSTASNWADSYPKNQWIDMGEYYFYIANSQAEAVQKCCYDFTHSIREILEPRYPNRKVYEAAWTTQNGNVPVIVLASDYTDASGYHRPKFVWE